MRLDSQLLFSDNQAVTSTAYSENVVQIASTGNGLTEAAFGYRVPLLIQVTEDFAGCTSITVAVETSETEDFTSYDTLAETSDVALANLTEGYRFAIGEIPKGNLGFMRLKYTVSVTATSGAVTAAIVDDLDNSFQDM